MPDMINVTIDGVEYEVEAGQTILQAARSLGITIPYFCWHKHLSVSGNCRMCLVNIEPGPPKPQIACGTPLTDGMKVTTKSEKLEKARKGVLEFLLINHPLDCPVCDEAYECKLQDYTYTYGPSSSRFIELHDKKRIYRRIDLGEKLFVEMNRCIECTRCVRFLKELGGEHELERYHRGHMLKIFTYKPAFESDFAINAADLCPVGALEDKNYHFKARNWDLLKVPTVCPSCSIGCNTELHFFDNDVKRLMPRENDAVNACWMCDYGRHNTGFIGENRLRTASVRKDADFVAAPFDEALNAAAGELEKVKAQHGGPAIGILLSSWMPNEALFAGKQLADALDGARVGVMRGFNHRPIVPVMSDILPKTLVSDDKSPNSTGAELLSLKQGDEDFTFGHEMLTAIEDGRIKALVIFHEDLLKMASFDQIAVRKAFARLDALVVVGWTSLDVASMASVVLPAQTYAEQNGSFTSHHKRVQRIRRTVKPVGEEKSELEILTGLGRHFDASFGYDTPKDAFEAMTRQEPEFAGLNWAEIGDLGVLVASARQSDD